MKMCVLCGCEVCDNEIEDWLVGDPQTANSDGGRLLVHVNVCNLCSWGLRMASSAAADAADAGERRAKVQP